MCVYIYKIILTDGPSVLGNILRLCPHLFGQHPDHLSLEKANFAAVSRSFGMDVLQNHILLGISVLNNILLYFPLAIMCRPHMAISHHRLSW